MDFLKLDTHIDTLGYALEGFDLKVRHESGTPGAHCVDLPRMQEGGLSGACFAVFVPQGPLTASGFQEAGALAHRMLDLLEATARQASELAGIAVDPAQVRTLHAAGKIAMIPAMENGYPLGLDMEHLDTFWKRGIRYLTLCHNGANQICGSHQEPGQGLTPFGVQVIRKMNRLGMMVDLSHASEATCQDVLSIAQAPVIASHTSCRALCDHSRNLPDDLLRAIAQTRGVVNACMYPPFLQVGLRERSEREGSVALFVDHLDHLVQTLGVDHVGIGSDFDGGGGVSDCHDASQMGRITDELERRGYDPKAIRQIWGENQLRVWQQILETASETPCSR